MNTLFQNILTASFHGSIVILVVIALRLVLKKTPKKFICLLWLLAGIRLLMPFEIQSALSLQPQPERVAQAQQWQSALWREPGDDGSSPVQTPAANPEISGGIAGEAEPDGAVQPVGGLSQEPAVTGAVPATEPAETPSMQRSGLQIAGLMPYFWLAIACCFGAYSIYSYLHLRLQVREAIKIPGGWECDHIETAFILGFIKPKIYIPMGMSPNVRKYILAHERTHLEKGDHWFKMIGFLALALHWFNPLVWVAYILLCKDIEMACDERVVQFMDLNERKHYSAALLSCSTNRAHFAACPVAFGEVSVKYRIKSVLNYRKPSFWISLLGVIAIIFVAVCLVTSPAENGEAPDVGETLGTEADQTARRIEEGFQAILSRDSYAVSFFEATFDGSVGWQIQYHKQGENTLWRSTDHLNEEGHMVLDGQDYTLVKEGWLASEPEEDPLEGYLARFDLTGKELLDVTSSTKDNGGDTYEEVTLTAQWRGEDGKRKLRPMTFCFNTDGELTRANVEDDELKGADIFVFNNESFFEDTATAFDTARQNIADPSEVGPIEPPTEDELLMKEWGVDFRVDDDLLTRRGGEAWFVQANGYDMAVSTDNAYWLEKKTTNGWEKLSALTENIQWPEGNYTLGHGKYTVVPVDWSGLYGELSSGTYRMGKTFTNWEIGKSATGYAEFEIYYNDASTAEQTAAVERCYAALEKLKAQKTIHWRSNTSWLEETWYNNGNYLMIRTFQNHEWEMEQNIGRVDIFARWDGAGYTQVHEDPEDWGSDIIGMRLSTLKADRAGWQASFADDLSLLFYERSNKTITFPDGIGVVSDEMVRFCQTWPVVGLEYDTASAQLTYRFDDAGNLIYMAYKPLYEESPFDDYIEILDTSAEEIDAKIKSYTENPYVGSFSWAEAKAKYTSGEFNIRENNFINTSGAAISSPVEAAQRALKEYPNLGEYLDIEISHDDSAGMWKVTVQSYVDYQSTYGYRDIYLDDNGVTQLLVYEGPIGWDETRK